MNFSVSVQKIIALLSLYVEGYVFVWVLNHFFTLPISSSIVYFIVLQFGVVWFGIFAIAIADAYDTRNKTLDNLFYGQKVIVGGPNFFIGIFGTIACIIAFPMLIILTNLNYGKS
ncbi:MAG: hypothetical protein ACKUBY_02675 [Candidatus Moraniibacteriota bacterium]|jgi:hypothetical protein